MSSPEESVVPSANGRPRERSGDTPSSPSDLSAHERRLLDVVQRLPATWWEYEPGAGRLSFTTTSSGDAFGRRLTAFENDPPAIVELLHADDQTKFARACQRVRGGTEVEDDLRVLDADGALRWVRVRAVPLRDERGHVVRVAGTMFDITGTHRRSDAEGILATTGRFIGGSLDLQETLDAIARALVPAFVDLCIIHVVHDGSLRVSAHAFTDPIKERAFLEMRRRFPLNDNPLHPIWEVVGSGQPMLIPTVGPDLQERIAPSPEHRALAASLFDGSWILVPMTKRGRTLGVLAVAAASSRPCLDEHDVGLAMEIGRRAATAVEHAQLYADARRATESQQALAIRLRLLSEISRIVAVSRSELPDLLREVCRFLADHLGDLCMIRLLSADGRWLSLAGLHHRDPSVRALAEAVFTPPLDAGSPESARVLNASGTVTGNAADIERLRPLLPDAYRRYFDHRPIRGFVTVALKARGRNIGTLMVAHEAAAGEYTDDDVSLILETANRVATAIDNVNLLAEAQRATAMRDRIIAVVSHDIANSLNAICAGTSLLQTRARGDAESRVLSVVQRSARHAGRLMNDLLDSAAIDTGSLTVAPADDEASALVNEACDLFEERARAASIALIRPDGGICRVRADRNRVVQVLENLIGNALRFTPAGGAVTVDSFVDGDRACFRVRDTGSGIAPDEAERIFDRFYQRNSAGHRGLGLGLSISRAIVEAHGGRIWVDSRPGEGSVFCFTLPLAASRAPATDGPRASRMATAKHSVEPDGTRRQSRR